jgi:hypothetical protein
VRFWLAASRPIFSLIKGYNFFGVLGVHMAIQPFAPRIKEIVLEEVRNSPSKSLIQIGKEWGVGYSTIRQWMMKASISRKRGRKSWRVTKHPQTWTPEQRRIAYTEARIREGLDKMYEEILPTIQGDDND